MWQYQHYYQKASLPTSVGTNFVMSLELIFKFYLPISLRLGAINNHL